VRIVQGSQLRTTVNLNLRDMPVVTAPSRATLQTGILVQALAPPANGWLHCVVHGWRHTDHPDTLFSEPDVSSSIKTRSGALGWHSVSLEGYASMGQPQWWQIVDGPT
jgi:hypothetical protein